MARKIKTEQDKAKAKKKKIIIIVLVILILIVSLSVCIYMNTRETPKNVIEVKELDNLSDYNYKLTDRDSKYFKSEFEKLKKIVNSNEVNEEEYVIQVARMFVIDLYTMSTKVNKYDIGGLEYYYVTKKDMFERKVMDTLYSTMLDDTYGDRKQVLPEIKDVENISNEMIEYLMGEEKVDGYLVKLKMTYVDDLGYDTEASVVICKEDGVRWSVVDFQPTLNPEYEE